MWWIQSTLDYALSYVRASGLFWRARYERRPDYQRGLWNYDSGLRNGFRPRTVQTAEGELEIEIPQVREAAETFASRLFPGRRSCCGPSRSRRW